MIEPRMTWEVVGSLAVSGVYRVYIPNEVETAIRKKATAAPKVHPDTIGCPQWYAERSRAEALEQMHEADTEQIESWRTRAEAAEGALREIEQESNRRLSVYSQELALRAIGEKAKQNGGGSPLAIMSGYAAILELAERALTAESK